MITGALKNKIDQLWKIFWTGGITNPLDVIEQMTYLLFIRDLENAKDTPYKWSELRHLAPEKMYTTVVYLYIEYLLGKLTYINSQSSQQSSDAGTITINPFSDSHKYSQKLNLREFDSL